MSNNEVTVLDDLAKRARKVLEANLLKTEEGSKAHTCTTVHPSTRIRPI